MKARGSRSGVEHDEAGDEYVQVSVMERANFAENIASCEDEGSPGEYACHLPAFVAAGSRQKELRALQKLTYMH